MKNYLFAPFKDDEEKITHFNHLDKNLDHNELILFIGRLESYYDVIISKLQSENAVAVADERVIEGLEAEVKTLKQNNHYKKNLTLEIEGLHVTIEGLKEENKELKLLSCDDDCQDDVNLLIKLQAENKGLKEENKTIKQCYEGSKVRRRLKLADNKELKAEIEELKAEVKEYRVDNKHLANRNGVASLEIIKEKDVYINELRAEISDLSLNPSHHTPQYKEEAEEYFNHNPNTEKLWFFMIGDSEVDEDGDVRRTLNVGADSIAECDNLSGDISVKVYN